MNLTQSDLHQLGEAIREFLPNHSSQRSPPGRAPRWKPLHLVWVNLLMAWDEGQTLPARWDHAFRARTKLAPHWRLGESSSGFTQALIQAITDLIPVLVKRLQVAMNAVAGSYRESGQWVTFAVDNRLSDDEEAELYKRRWSEELLIDLGSRP